MKARRKLPVPVSLTGLGFIDGDNTRFWTMKIRDVADKMRNIELKSEVFAENVPPALKVLIESDDPLVTEEYEQIKSLYNESKDSIEGIHEDAPSIESMKDIHFPHSLSMVVRDEVVKRVQELKKQHSELAHFEDETKDLLKHHDVLKYFSNKLTNMKSSNPLLKTEFTTEMAGWRDEFWRRSYGTSDLNEAPSQIPCGGCGSLLHCADPGIPGYLPSERFKDKTDDKLKLEQCQRCEFLHHFNVAIDVTVEGTEYEKHLKTLKDKKGIVILMVDLLDFPASIWPRIVHIFGANRKIYVVGNKVDLLPKDGPDYLDRIRSSLKASMAHAGIQGNTHLKHLALISAKTGFGIEPLITRIFSNLKQEEDIFLVGSANVGKSTLFNALLQSDLCATRENDLIQRATTSIWPGTTLSLLKFPVKRVESWQLQLRNDRLVYEDRVKAEEHRLRRSLWKSDGNPTITSLQDRLVPKPESPEEEQLVQLNVGSTFRSEVPFTIESNHPLARRTMNPKPFDESNFAKLHAEGKRMQFVYDTPGAVFDDQILPLFTTQELLKVSIRSMIQPRVFSLQPFQSLFVAGVGRVDVIHSRQNVLLTVFASAQLPIHVVYTEEADRFYDLYVGTEMMVVPMGGPDRIKFWPQLKPKEFDVEGISWKESAADVILSSAGWISVTIGREEACVLKAFTPEGRGCIVRRPSLLPFAVNMRGRRVVGTPGYNMIQSSRDLMYLEDGFATRTEEYRKSRSDYSSLNAFKLRQPN